VQFGESCSHIFQYLGLQRRTVDDETFWFLPELEHYDNEKTPINTQRAFMEDARSEIQALIEEQGASEVQPWSAARFRLLQALNCPPSHDWNNFRFDANDVHLRALGTLPGPGDEVLKYAYQSQVDADPGNLRYYFEALKAKASTEDLLLFVGCQESLLDSHPQAFEPTFNPRPSSNDPLAQAYAHFNLGQDCSDDDFIIRKYHVFAQQSPAQKAQHRNQLFKIGSLRQSKKIMTAAADDFSLEEACDYLQLDREIKQGSEPSVELLETYVSLAVEVRKSSLFPYSALLPFTQSVSR
jgi:ubiquitin carboxyl-terminal hydrolase 25/28